MIPEPADAEDVARALRAAMPHAEPSELDQDALGEALMVAGADPDDADLVAEVLVAWDALL